MVAFEELADGRFGHLLKHADIDPLLLHHLADFGTGVRRVAAGRKKGKRMDVPVANGQIHIQTD
jgi:hypothetical protein